MYTTFEEWSKSKVWHNKLPVDDLEDTSGFIYADGAFIQLSHDPSKGPWWWSIVEHSECLSHDLNHTEKWLWDLWSKNNGEFKNANTK